jgi:cytoplasmic iron level regulating protein YaaA (DUF328/UPF0246 family)
VLDLGPAQRDEITRNAELRTAPTSPAIDLYTGVLYDALDALTDGGLLIDLRSGTYVNLHRPAGDLAARTATIRVLSEVDGVRKVVSHFNKATKGEIVRGICENGVDARTPAALAGALRDLGWTVEIDGNRLDVVI